MRGMGKYTAVERELAHLSSDEVNELYLSGELDKIYEEYDRTGEVRVKRATNTKRKKKAKGE